MTVPDELRGGGARRRRGSDAFFWDVLLPLSKTTMAALFVISSSTAGTSISAAAHHDRRVHVYRGDRHQAHDTSAATPPMSGPDHGHRHPGDAGPPAVVVLLMQKWSSKVWWRRKRNGRARISRRQEELRRAPGHPRRHHGCSGRRVRGHRRSFRLRQIDAAPHGRRARADHFWRDPHRQPRGQRPGAQGSRPSRWFSRITPL